MVRTQIYLTENQIKTLSSLAKAEGKKQSELIREAIDFLIDHNSPTTRKKVLEKAAGLWKNRTDIPDFESVRSEWDRK